MHDKGQSRIHPEWTEVGNAMRIRRRQKELSCLADQALVKQAETDLERASMPRTKNDPGSHTGF